MGPLIKSSCDVRNEALKVLVGRPACRRVSAHRLAEHRCPLPHRAAFVTVHQLLEHLPYPRRRYHLAVLLTRPHKKTGLEVLADQLRVPWLVGVHGPGQDGLPVAHALHGRVPAAVAQERRSGDVGQDLQLRCPPGDHQSPPLGRLGELGQQLRGTAVTVAREHVAAVGVAQHPDEPLVAVAKRRGELRDLLVSQRGYGAERDVDNGRRRLLVEPLQALVPLLALLGRAPVEQRIQRADGEHLLAASGHLLGDKVDELALERATRVHEEPGAERNGFPYPRPLAEELQELLRDELLERGVSEAVLAQEPVDGVHRLEEVRRRSAVEPEPLTVGQPRGLFRGEGIHEVVQDDDAAVGGGDLAEERSERPRRVGDESLPHGQEVRGERRVGGRVGRRGGVRGDGELVEFDAAEGIAAPPVHAGAGLADVLRGRCVVHGQPPRGE